MLFLISFFVPREAQYGPIRCSWVKELGGPCHNKFFVTMSLFIGK